MEMEKTNPLINDTCLKALEQLWGFNLPKAYRNFLLECNGGEPKKKCFDLKDKSDGSVIDEFLSIINNYNSNLLLDLKDVGKRCPSHMIPIADDGFGNRILLSAKGADRGKVYFWDHDMEANDDETPDYSNLSLIADSFEEFTNGLYEPEDEAI